MSTTEWQETAHAPDGILVMTKIHDARGERNHAALKRSGNLWFVPDGSMYVYYRPTHFRELTQQEHAIEVERVRKAAKALLSVANRL